MRSAIHPPSWLQQHQAAASVLRVHVGPAHVRASLVALDPHAQGASLGRWHHDEGDPETPHQREVTLELVRMPACRLIQLNLPKDDDKCFDLISRVRKTC